MTKKFFGGLVFLALAAGGFAMQGNSSKTALSPLQMENLEALSLNENPMIDCMTYCKSRSGYVCWLQTSAGFTIYCDEMVSWSYLG